MEKICGGGCGGFKWTDNEVKQLLKDTVCERVSKGSLRLEGRSKVMIKVRWLGGYEFRMQNSMCSNQL